MYFQKKRVIAMLLAGGQGSRLKVLTEKTAKPAVPFGGKYRIIDFPLSNCVNSGIDTVGILTQYQPLELNEYIGNGQPWNLNKTHSCAQVLPPYERHDKKSGWYKGTANAIYQNIDFIERFNPDYVVVLSGDHIYKMDYAAMVEYHEEHEASCTIAVRNVPIEEAPRFGILNTNPDMSIYEFEEKPAHPKSTNASMGIYVFTWSVLKDALLFDEDDPNSSNDFGKDIIPSLVPTGRLFAYNFYSNKIPGQSVQEKPYWRDVGTLKSYFEANMDLRATSPQLDLYNPKWPIYNYHFSLPPAKFVHNEEVDVHGLPRIGKAINSIVCDGCIVSGSTVTSSILFNSVFVHSYATVHNSILLNDVDIGEHCRIRNCIIDKHNVIPRGTIIGYDREEDAKRYPVVDLGPEYGPDAWLTVIPKDRHYQMLELPKSLETHQL